MIRKGNYAEGVLIEGVNILPESISNNDNDQVDKGNIILGIVLQGLYISI